MRPWVAGLSALILLWSHAWPTAAEEQSEAPEPAGYAGEEMCAACHPEQTETYGKTAHGWALADTARPPERRGCEACHGPGAAHADAGGGKGVGNLQTFAAPRSPAERSAVCLGCHAGAPEMPAFRSSAHALSGVACTDCHRAHDPPATPLLRKATPQLCYGCHLEVRTEFALPERHKVEEGVLTCLDCHNAHGTRNTIALRGTNNRECFRCHGEIEGPFVFEHAAVLTEGCVRCHVPHGGTARHLLRYQQVAQLCYQCHTVTPASHLQPSFRDCTRCHVSIHGSNIDPRFLEQ